MGGEKEIGGEIQREGGSQDHRHTSTHTHTQQQPKLLTTGMFSVIFPFYFSVYRHRQLYLERSVVVQEPFDVAPPLVAHAVPHRLDDIARVAGTPGVVA